MQGMIDECGAIAQHLQHLQHLQYLGRFGNRFPAPRKLVAKRTQYCGKAPALVRFDLGVHRCRVRQALEDHLLDYKPTHSDPICLERPKALSRRIETETGSIANDSIYRPTVLVVACPFGPKFALASNQNWLMKSWTKNGDTPRKRLKVKDFDDGLRRVTRATSHPLRFGLPRERSLSAAGTMSSRSLGSPAFFTPRWRLLMRAGASFFSASSPASALRSFCVRGRRKTLILNSFYPLQSR